MPTPTRQHPPVKLTKGVIDRLKPGPKDQFVWDAQDKGFAAKISSAGKISFLVQARLTPTSNPIRISVGDYGVFSPDQAREVARDHLRNIAKGITAEQIDVPFYADGTTPVLVRCEWSKLFNPGNMVPKSLAVPLMLEQELPCWRWAERAESWETMRPYLLGVPHGARSSLFVDQDTAIAMKNIYMALVQSGMFGSLKMG